MVWNKDLPDSSGKIRTAPAQIQENNQAIQHGEIGLKQWSVNLLDRSVAAVTDPNDPVRADDVMFLYAKNDGTETELWVEDDADPVVPLQVTQRDTVAGTPRLGSAATNIGFESFSHDKGTTSYDEANFVTAWGHFTSAGGTTKANGITCGAPSPAGQYVITFDNALTTAGGTGDEYCVQVTGGANGLGGISGTGSVLTATTFQVNLFRASDVTGTSAAFHVMVLGGR